MPDPARSAIIRRLDEITATTENHGIEEDFLNSRVCYINRITDPPGYFPYGYKASKARRNSEAWISVGFFWCARWAHVLTGESPQSARQWEGYSRSQGCPP